MREWIEIVDVLGDKNLIRTSDIRYVEQIGPHLFKRSGGHTKIVTLCKTFRTKMPYALVSKLVTGS